MLRNRLYRRLWIGQAVCSGAVEPGESVHGFSRVGLVFSGAAVLIIAAGFSSAVASAP